MTGEFLLFGKQVILFPVWEESIDFNVSRLYMRYSVIYSTVIFYDSIVAVLQAWLCILFCISYELYVLAVQVYSFYFGGFHVDSTEPQNIRI